MHLVMIELDADSKARVKNLFEMAHEHVYCDHLTVAFKPNAADSLYLGTLLGTEAKMYAVGHVQDEKGQALIIQGVRRVDPGTPHITLSCAEGVKPKYSNEMIQRLWIDSKKRDGMTFELTVPLELIGMYKAL